MEDSRGFCKFPWEVPCYLKNFIPGQVKALSNISGTVVISWHERNAVVFKFRTLDTSTSADISKILSSKPVSSQVITLGDEILDVIAISEQIVIIDIKGSVQLLQPKKTKKTKPKMACDEENCSIISTFKLSPLKKVLAVFSPDETEGPPQFGCVHCSADSSQYIIEVYSVLLKMSGKAQLQPLYTQCISHDKLKIQGKKPNCCILLLTKTQTSTLFNEAQGLQVLLLGLPSGQLYATVLSATKSQRHVRMLYQSSWGIHHILCPPDGSSIIAVLDGGLMVVLSVAPKRNGVESSGHLSFKTVMLPSSVTACYSPVDGTILCTNGADIWLVQNFKNEALDVFMLPLKGVIAVYGLEGTTLCISATTFKVFYAIDLSKMTVKDHGTHPHLWSGGDLNTPVQFVQEMKWQAHLLAQLRKELDYEDELLSGICATARAKLLSDNFTIEAKIYDAEQISSQDGPISLNTSNYQYKIAIEICNNSDENFLPPLWEVSVTVENQNGELVSKNVALNKTFSSKCPFSTVLPISLTGKDFRLPIHVRAHLVAQLVESNEEVTKKWLSIVIGEKSMDISHFLSYSLIPPNPSKSEKLSFEGSIEQISLGYRGANIQTSFEDANSTKADATLTISIPEQLRSGTPILNKTLLLCQHRCDPMLLKQLSESPGEVLSVWMSAFGQSVKFTLNQDCGFLTLQSVSIELLHMIKSWLISFLRTSDNIRMNLDDALQRCQNLKALLESERFNQDISCKDLISIYQDLRNNVSAFLPL